MANWARTGKDWHPLDMLAPGYKGPVVFCDETQSITWFSETADRVPVTHREPAREHENGPVKVKKDQTGQEHEVWTPERMIKPAFWAPAVVTD